MSGIFRFIFHILSFIFHILLFIFHVFIQIPEFFIRLWHDSQPELLPKIFAEIAVGVATLLVVHFIENIKRNWNKIKVWFQKVLSRQRIVLLWIDSEDPAIMHRVAGRLRANSPYLRILTLKAPADVLYYPTRTSVLAAVIFISTDVTKLSSDDKVRREIEEMLVNYALGGGGLVTAHDVIYRRTRNLGLTSAYGGTVEHFHSTPNAVVYEKCADQASHPIALRLPERFSLDDRESLGVTWHDEIATTANCDDDKVHILFRDAAFDSKRALVVARNHGKGRLVWLNSGDNSREGLAPSIAQPSPDFIRLLAASLHWVAKEQQLAPDAPLIVAHRGSQPYGGENTMRAFQTAIGLHADYIECDIRRTSDGVLVLHHDPAIGNAILAQHTFAELEPLAIAAGRPLVRLEDLLKEASGKIGLDLELKETGYEADIAAMLQAHNYAPAAFVVTSFLDLALQRFRECYPAARCGLLLEYRRWLRNRFPVRRMRGLGVDFVAPNERLVTPRFARRMQRAGFPLWVWTVNDCVRVAELLHTPGVEAVITDRVNDSKQEQAKARKE